MEESPLVLILRIGSIIIVIIMLIAMSFQMISTTNRDIETVIRMNGLSIRNMILTLSTFEKGVRHYDFTRPEFKVTVDNEKVIIDYVGNYKPEKSHFEFLHFSDNVEGGTVPGVNAICIVKTDKVRVYSSGNALCKIK